MIRVLLSALLALALLAATPAVAAKAQKFAGTLPVTVDGSLLIEVSANEVEENTERVAFGTLTVDGKEYAVEVPEALAAKVPAKGGKVRITLGRESLEFGFPTYKVSALEVLD